MFPVTVFASSSTKGKVPYSPHGDNTFDFSTIEVNTLEQVMRQIQQNFVLNLPLELEHPTRVRRTKQMLSQYLPETLSYFVLDVDDVKTPEAMRHILDYFKSYRCVILESRSHNSIDNFNLKGVVQCNLTLNQLRLVLDQIFFELADFGTVDRSVSRCPTFNAPIPKYKVLLNTSETGASILKFSDFDISSLGAARNPEEVLELKLSDLSNLNLESAKTIPDICLSIFQSQGFKAVSVAASGGIRFSHPSEVKSPGGYIWFESYPYLMRHFNSTRNVNIRDIVKTLPEYVALKEQEDAFNQRFTQESVYGHVLEVNQRYLEVTPEVQDAIRDFIELRDGVFTVHSPMGTGKSAIIKEMICAAHQAEQSVLLVTPRTSVALDFKEKYGLKLYNRDQYEVGDSLICQYDSLWRYNIRCFDVVIYDEFCSTLVHSRTGINSNDVRLFSIFTTSLKKKVVIADAFINGFDTLLKQPPERKFILRNHYRDDAHVKVYSNANAFKDQICRCSQLGKISISTTSVAFGKACAVILEELGCRVLSIFGDTPEKIKEQTYRYLRDLTDDHFDVLIYTPTVTVGLSIECNIPRHFHFDCSRSCDVISSLQMVKRVRGAKEIHIFVQNSAQYCLTSASEICADWLSNISDKEKLTSWLFTCNDYGDLSVSPRGKMVAEIDALINTLKQHHRKSFLKLLDYQFSGNVDYSSEFLEYNRFKKYETANQSTKKRMLEVICQQYLRLSELDRLVMPRNEETEKIFQVVDQLLPVDDSTKKQIFEAYLKDNDFIRKCQLYNLLESSRKGKFSSALQGELLAASIGNNDTELYQFISDLRKVKDVRECYRNAELPPEVKRVCTNVGYKTQELGDGTRIFSIPPEIKELARYVVSV